MHIQHTQAQQHVFNERYQSKQLKSTTNDFGIQIPKAVPSASFAGMAKVNNASQSVPSHFEHNFILLDESSGSGEDHEYENIKSVTNSISTSLKSGMSAPIAKKAVTGQFFDKRIILYKTEMCRAFTETGVCKYGFQCQFAHYVEELRPVLRHPRYKTDVCKTWWKTGGKCPYGMRCCFIHDESAEELAKLRGVASGCSSSVQSDVMMVKKISFSLDDYTLIAPSGMKKPQVFVGEELVLEEHEAEKDDGDLEEAWCHLPQELQQLLL